MKRVLALLLLVLVVNVTGPLTVSAQNPNPRILPPVSHSFGHSYAEWSAAWWQWAMAIDGATNPLEDPDGRWASLGQDGTVWFLAGTGVTANNQLVERSVTVPAGRALFFPVLNGIWVTFPQFGDRPFSEPGAEQYARDSIAVHPEGDILALEIDGQPQGDLTLYRVRSPVFTVFLPTYNWWDVVLNPFGLEVTGGMYPDCVSDGYWIMLAPLPRGPHTIHFRGENIYGFVTELVYHLNVR